MPDSRRHTVIRDEMQSLVHRTQPRKFIGCRFKGRLFDLLINNGYPQEERVGSLIIDRWRGPPKL